jgi:protein-L-isoaspartate(D-aspartate) O-methyltransferase
MKSAATIVFLLASFFTQDPSREKERMQMVARQIAARGVTDPATLEAMRKVPRHLFVPAEAELYAYDDRPLPIGYGQTISQPFIVGYMTAILNLKKEHSVLEIGTGSGYQAAILAEIVKEVYTIEIVGPLGIRARDLLDSRYDNIDVKIDDGYFGWSEHAPFDAIIVTAAAGQIPPSLIQQLRGGGRMIIPVGSPYQVQQLMLVEKTNEGKIRTTGVMPVRFVPFRRK